MRVESNGKAKYFYEFIDERFRLFEVRFSKAKSQMLQVTKRFVAVVKRQQCTKIRCLQSDNGTGIWRIPETIGIKRCLTIPYNPEQNGVAERKNRTLLDTA